VFELVAIYLVCTTSLLLNTSELAPWNGKSGGCIASSMPVSISWQYLVIGRLVPILFDGEIWGASKTNAHVEY
jgi:hypothetical protein